MGQSEDTCLSIAPKKILTRRKMLEFVYKSKCAVVVYKPPLMPSQPDNTSLPDALTLTKEALGAMGEESDLYLIHRLDTVVGGILVFARNKAAARALSSLVARELVGKEYFAIVSGDVYGGTLTDYLIKDSRLNKAIVKNSSQNGAKYAELDYSVLEKVNTDKGVYSLVKITLKTGRFHQIRAQFSSRGMPLIGDKKYGSHDFFARQPALFAYRLDIDLGDEKIAAAKYPDLTTYPWNLFSEKSYKGN